MFVGVSNCVFPSQTQPHTRNGRTIASRGLIQRPPLWDVVDYHSLGVFNPTPCGGLTRGYPTRLSVEHGATTTTTTRRLHRDGDDDDDNDDGVVVVLGAAGDVDGSDVG